MLGRVANSVRQFFDGRMLCDLASPQKLARESEANAASHGQIVFLRNVFVWEHRINILVAATVLQHGKNGRSSVDCASETGMAKGDKGRV